MKNFSRGLAVDIGYSSLKALAGETGLELPLERTAAGDLTPACREATIRELRSFLEGAPRGRRAACAVPARGVSLRRLTLPRASRDETEKLLAFQLEQELPLPPERVAWAYQMEGEANGFAAAPETNGRSPRNGREMPALREVTLAALRRELLDEYEAILREAGLTPSFTVGVLAASWSCPREEGRHCVLDLGKTHSELLTLDGSKPVAVRTISWGGDSATEALSRALGIDLAEAEALKRRWAGAGMGGFILTADDADEAVLAAIRESVKDLARLVAEAWPADPAANGAGRPSSIHIVGGSAGLPGLAEDLAASLGGGIDCRAIGVSPGPGRSAVTLGLLEGARVEGRELPLTFLSPGRRKDPAQVKRPPSILFWVSAAAILVAISLGLRFGIPIARLPGLEARLEGARALLGSLPSLDRELAFLESVDRAQVPYLEALVALSRSAPPGTLFESLSLNRQGEVSIQGKTASFEKANDLRGKLALSGWFTQVVLQEQGPSKQKGVVDFRMSARLRPGAAPVPVPPSALVAPPAASAPPPHPGPPPPPGAVAPPAAAPPTAVPEPPAGPQEKRKARK